LRWIDVDLDHKVIMIGQQRIAYGHTVEDGEPKTKASRRTIALDRITVALLRTHLKRQQAERLAAGGGWQNSGKVFTNPDGRGDVRGVDQRAHLIGPTHPIQAAARHQRRHRVYLPRPRSRRPLPPLARSPVQRRSRTLSCAGISRGAASP
jgi:hypothetical protein